MQDNPLRKWRLDNGITQTQLAEDMGITQRTVSHIESGGNTDFDNLRAVFEITKGKVTPNMMVLGHEFAES